MLNTTMKISILRVRELQHDINEMNKGLGFQTCQWSIQMPTKMIPMNNMPFLQNKAYRDHGTKFMWITH